jgi:3-deoxy-D-arabino-heptulosonate 7-phosphate (DAHP) synthase class II
MLSDRFGAFEAIANSSIKLARVAPEEELAMEVLVAEAVLEFAGDSRDAVKLAARMAGQFASPDVSRADFE